MAVFLRPTKMNQVLFGYWLTIPLLFGGYILTLAAVKNSSVSGVFFSIPSLTLTSIIVLLIVFQLFGLYIIGNSTDCRHSLLGFYLKFNMVQQLLSVNILGFLICLLFYRSLVDGKEESALPKHVQWTTYGLMGFIGFISILVFWVRLSL